MELYSILLLITNLLTCCARTLDGLTLNPIKDNVKANEEHALKKKEVNFEASTDKDQETNEVVQATEPGPVIKPEAVENAGVPGQETLQRTDSSVGGSKVVDQGANQTGTAKRKKKKKEEVSI